MTASKSGRAFVSAVPTLDTAAYAAGDVLTTSNIAAATYAVASLRISLDVSQD